MSNLDKMKRLTQEAKLIEMQEKCYGKHTKGIYYTPLTHEGMRAWDISTVEWMIQSFDTAAAAAAAELKNRGKS